MSKRKFSGSINGKGYYIALIACAVALGITGYLYYTNANSQPQADHAAVATQPTVPGNVQAVATDPTVSTQAPTESTTAPTVGKQPMKTAKPVSGEVIHVYAMEVLSYNQTTRDWRVHDGIDIAAEAGAPVGAAAEGTVYTVYTDDALGTTVVIRHEDGYTTSYASLDAEVSVAPGDTVSLGQHIGTVGQSALLENAIGPHLHFAVTCNGESVDPEDFLGIKESK